MSYDVEMKLAKKRDEHHALDEQLYQNEVKLSKAQESIKQGLDSTGQVQAHADKLTQKIADQKAQLQKIAEIIAVLETQL